MIAKAGKTFTASGNIVVKMPRYIKPLIPDYPKRVAYLNRYYTHWDRDDGHRERAVA